MILVCASVDAACAHERDWLIASLDPNPHQRDFRQYPPLAGTAPAGVGQGISSGWGDRLESAGVFPMGLLLR